MTVVEEVFVSKTLKVERVECEYSARIRPGDRRCLSFFRSYTEDTCRNCDLADKIEKQVNPVFIQMSLDEVRLIKENADESALIDKEGLESKVLKLQGRFIPEVIASILARTDLKELVLRIRGCVRGFREVGQAKSARGKLTWFDFRGEMLEEISTVQYYELRFAHPDLKVVKKLYETYSDNAIKVRPKKYGVK